MTKEVVIGLSGGVDSSVAAYLLQEDHQVRAIFMQNWQEAQDEEYCTIKEDSLDAIAVADCLGIDIDIVNFAREYEERVFRYFVQEYQKALTPNPDILCNSEIKFDVFLKHAQQEGSDYIATGHYVRKEKRDGVYHLLKAKDQKKDQTYFLYRLKPEQIAPALFPLGVLEKTQVRHISADLNLPTAYKKDSTGICFIGERPFRKFLQQYIPTTKGNMVTLEGEVVGEHIGLAFYTLGQRKGLGIGGRGDAWFVAGKNLADNSLIVVQGHDHPALFSREIVVADLSFTLGVAPEEGRYTVKVRYRTADVPVDLSYENKEKSRIRLFFPEPVWAATPGQSAVLYDGEVCLGGGIIESVAPLSTLWYITAAQCNS